MCNIKLKQIDPKTGREILEVLISIEDENPEKWLEETGFEKLPGGGWKLENAVVKTPKGRSNKIPHLLAWVVPAYELSQIEVFKEE